jgi:hypothetical protein
MKIQLTREQLQTIGSLGIFAAKGDDAKWTPVLSETRITLDTTAGTLTAAATDRYCVMQYTTQYGDITAETYPLPEKIQFRLTAAMSKFLKTNTVKKWAGIGEIELLKDGSISANLAGVRFTDKAIDNKFPEVETLITNWQAANELVAHTLRAEFLARLDELKEHGKKVSFWNLMPGQNPNGNAGKPGPLKVTNGTTLTGLIQPNLIKDAADANR